MPKNKILNSNFAYFYLEEATFGTTAHSLILKYGFPYYWQHFLILVRGNRKKIHRGHKLGRYI